MRTPLQTHFNLGLSGSVEQKLPEDVRNGVDVGLSGFGDPTRTTIGLGQRLSQTRPSIESSLVKHETGITGGIGRAGRGASSRCSASSVAPKPKRYNCRACAAGNTLPR